MIRAVVTDIEGTTTPIRFVHDVLFPHARARIPRLLAERASDPEVLAILERVRAIDPEGDPIAALERWQNADAKVEPLKTLQGLAWRDGYLSGALKGAVYPDVAPALTAWRAAGLRLAVYSSGSVEAQRLIFGHSVAGDLASLFDAFFDTTTGPKREAASYSRISDSLGVPPSEILFLSDVGAELDAAAAAGFVTCQLVRPEDQTAASPAHPVAADFDGVARRFGLGRDDPHERRDHPSLA